MNAYRTAGFARDLRPAVAAWSMTLAGVVHFLAALDHMDHQPEFVAFFLAVGVGQIALAPHPGRSAGPARMVLALSSTVGLLLLYLASRTVVLDLGPHSDRPEDPDLLGTIAVVAELVALVGLLTLLSPRWRQAAVNVVLVTGVAVWLSWFTGLIG